MTTPDPAPGPAPRLVLAVGAADPVHDHDQDHDRDHDHDEVRPGPGDRSRRLRDPDGAAAVLDAELPHLATGWRLVIVGTVRDVRVVRAAALARGALDEEITEVVTPGPAAVRVVCGVCHHRLDAAEGDLVRCPGCGADLEVTDHDSRTHGAVLGVPRVP